MRLIRKMGRDFLVSINFEFLEENKKKVEELIKKKFDKDGSILKSDRNFISFDVWNWDLEEEDFDEFKKYCYAISKQDYMAIDDTAFMWEEEEVEE